MSEEPRRSGRATKGQHNKKASVSPPPAPKTAKASKPKTQKKSHEPEPEPDEDDDKIRCICGNDDSKDKRAFIGCDACGVWQHNICMGITDDADDIPDHYFCEECTPSDHEETLQAIARGEKIWETRNKIYQAEKKSSKSRKGKGKGEEDFKPGWLKKDIPPQSSNGVKEEGAEAEPQQEPVQSKEVGTKRKRAEDGIKEEEPDETVKRSGRQDKRRKSSPNGKNIGENPDHALVAIDQLPAERQKIAQTLAKIILDDVQRRTKTGFKLPKGSTAKALSEHYAVRIEYAMHMNHGIQPQYAQQFRALNANMKKNPSLIERLLDGTLTPDALATMESKDMASEELQRERAVMKEALDRQAIAVEEEGPKYRNTHKGVELIEVDTQHATEPVNIAAPVRERPSISEGAENGGDNDRTQSPIVTTATTIKSPDGEGHRRSASQQFDMNSIWAKTAQSPTSQNGPRPMQMPPRRRSSFQQRRDQPDGAKVDPDVDRMLEDNDDTYSPAEYTSDETVVWTGKLVQSTGAGEPTVNARFVAGRDLAPTAPWRSILPEKLNVDGRLQIAKAEEYLCGLEWSHTSDVTVLCLTPYDDADAFNQVFEYFHTRSRYAVVGQGLPAMVKDLYIIPVETGASLPAHINKLEHCTIKLPVEQRMLLATFVIARSPDAPRVSNPELTPTTTPRPFSGQGNHIPTHVRAGGPGPAGSPLTAQTPGYSPSAHTGNGLPSTGYGAPSAYPPNPYSAPASSTQAPDPTQYSAGHNSHGPAAQHPNPLVNEILGPMQVVPTAQQILGADPNMSADKLRNLRRILDDDPNTQTDINALAAKLFS